RGCGAVCAGARGRGGRAGGGGGGRGGAPPPPGAGGGEGARGSGEAGGGGGRSSPRHTVWEDALVDDLVTVVRRPVGVSGDRRVTLSVALTARGRAALASRAA